MKKQTSKQLIYILPFRWIFYFVLLILCLLLIISLLPQHIAPHYVIQIIFCILWALSIVLLIYLMHTHKQHESDLILLYQNFQQQIEELKKAEESRQRLEKALLQGQKLQAIGTLAGGIAHDFNNILYAIMGYTEMAREDSDQKSIIYKNLNKVLEASKKGQNLIARILTFSRRQHHPFQPISMTQTLQDVLDLLYPTIPASVRIHFIQPLTDSVIYSDQTQFHQVIVNLITNAVDAMEGEGTITITIQRIFHEDTLVKFLPDAHLHPYYCKIDITDTGHGIDPTMQERIFEPFFTTKEVGHGTGLGLSTVHTIMAEHQGGILVNSKPGGGATFTLLLPEYQPQGEQNHGAHFTGRG